MTKRQVLSFDEVLRDKPEQVCLTSPNSKYPDQIACWCDIEWDRSDEKGIEVHVINGAWTGTLLPDGRINVHLGGTHPALIHPYEEMRTAIW